MHQRFTAMAESGFCRIELAHHLGAYTAKGTTGNFVNSCKEGRCYLSAEFGWNHEHNMPRPCTGTGRFLF